MGHWTAPGYPTGIPTHDNGTRSPAHQTPNRLYTTKRCRPGTTRDSLLYAACWAFSSILFLSSSRSTIGARIYSVDIFLTRVSRGFGGQRCPKHPSTQCSYTSPKPVLQLVVPKHASIGYMEAWGECTYYPSFQYIFRFPFHLMLHFLG